MRLCVYQIHKTPTILLRQSLPTLYRSTDRRLAHLQPVRKHCRRQAQLPNSPETEQASRLHATRLLTAGPHFHLLPRQQLANNPGNHLQVDPQSSVDAFGRMSFLRCPEYRFDKVAITENTFVTFQVGAG